MGEYGSAPRSDLRTYTTTHEMITLYFFVADQTPIPSTEVYSEAAHRIPQTHLNEENGLLPSRQAREVHRRKPTDGHGADAVEECVDVADVVLSIARIEYRGEDQWGESAVNV